MLELFVALFLMLATARLFGEVLRRAKQPSLVGELLAGMLIGTSVLNLIQPTSELTAITNFSLFFIMLLTGLNLHSKDIVEVGGKAITLSLPAFVLPLVFGALAGLGFGLGLKESLAVGLTLAITAVPVNSIILMDLGLLKTKLGTTVLTAGVIEDQLALIMLGVILQLPPSGSALYLDYPSLGWSIAKTLVFVVGVLLVDRALRRNPEWVRSQVAGARKLLMARESGIALLLIFGLGVALIAEALGLHFIIGAYFAGILLNQAVGEARLGRSLDVFSAVTFGIFAPLLFAFIGIQFNLYAIAGVAALFLALLAVGIVGKMAGGYFGARLGGFTQGDSAIIGSLMNSRGMVELVIASIIYQAGLVSLAIFSVVVAIGIITTIMSAILARAAVKTPGTPATVGTEPVPEPYGPK